MVAVRQRPATRAVVACPEAAPPIPYRTIAERVADWIRQQIVRGDMEPGMRLREARIARELQTSRAPVREAIGQLVQEGWATKRANESARIIAPTATRLREAATLRGVLEGYAVGLAMAWLDPHGIEMLAGLVTDMQQAVNEGDLSRAYELDLAFHESCGARVGASTALRHVETHGRAHPIPGLRHRRDGPRSPQDGGTASTDPRGVPKGRRGTRRRLDGDRSPGGRAVGRPGGPGRASSETDRTASPPPRSGGRRHGRTRPGLVRSLERGTPAARRAGTRRGPAIAAVPDSRATLSADQGVRQNDHQDR